MDKNTTAKDIFNYGVKQMLEVMKELESKIVMNDYGEEAIEEIGLAIICGAKKLRELL